MIALVRVDNRLVHGQILETWVPRLGIRRIVVVDAEAAGNPLARAAMSLALPEGIPVEVLAPGEADYARLAAAPEPVLLLFREVEGLARAAAAGLAPPLARRVNIGNVHYAAGRRPVSASVFLGEEEVRQIRALSDAGFEVEARAIPAHSPAGIAEIERRWLEAG